MQGNRGNHAIHTWRVCKHERDSNSLTHTARTNQVRCVAQLIRAPQLALISWLKNHLRWYRDRVTHVHTYTRTHIHTYTYAYTHIHSHSYTYKFIFCASAPFFWLDIRDPQYITFSRKIVLYFYLNQIHLFYISIKFLYIVYCISLPE